MPLSVLHIISISTEGSKCCFQFAQVLLQGDTGPYVKGSNFIFNLIVDIMCFLAGGLGFIPQVLLSPLHYSRALD